MKKLVICVLTMLLVLGMGLAFAEEDVYDAPIITLYDDEIKVENNLEFEANLEGVDPYYIIGWQWKLNGSSPELITVVYNDFYEKVFCIIVSIGSRALRSFVGRTDSSEHHQRLGLNDQ